MKMSMGKTAGKRYLNSLKYKKFWNFHTFLKVLKEF